MTSSETKALIDGMLADFERMKARALTAEAALANHFGDANNMVPPALAAPAGVVEGTRHPQFTQGMRSAQKRAVQWLHDRATSMNDPHAKAILDSAAFCYGGECKRALGL